MAGKRPGPDPYGERGHHTLRAPRDDLRHYDQCARDGGYPSLNAYLVAKLAEAHGRAVPDWAKPVEQGGLELAIGA